MNLTNCFIFIFILMLYHNSYAKQYEPYPLYDGINELDLNNDNIADNVIIAYFNNQTTHYNKTVMFLIKSEEGSLNHLPITDDYRLVLFDNKISVLNYYTTAFLLVKQNHQPILVIANKQGDNMLEMQYVELMFLRIEYEPDQPGVSPYLWRNYKTLISENRYFSAEDAFNELP